MTTNVNNKRAFIPITIETVEEVDETKEQDKKITDKSRNVFDEAAQEKMMCESPKEERLHRRRRESYLIMQARKEEIMRAEIAQENAVMRAYFKKVRANKEPE